jgi:hypothetical protein
MKNENTELVPAGEMPVERRQEPMTSLQILESAVRGGVTSENVAVVKEIIAMRREELAFENKAKFNRAFFDLKTELSKMNFYADKAAKTDTGQVAYRYCSEQELAAGLEPVLHKHGFTMLFGQRSDNERSTAVITLIHKDGHEEPREYSVRSGNTNRMKDATAADTGATTSAWRHLVIKMFGLKSRITEDDIRLEGDRNEKITTFQATELEHRAKMLNCEVAFLQFAMAAKFSDIQASRYEELDKLLTRKEKGTK